MLEMQFPSKARRRREETEACCWAGETCSKERKKHGNIGRKVSSHTLIAIESIETVIDTATHVSILNYSYLKLQASSPPHFAVR